VKDSGIAGLAAIEGLGDILEPLPFGMLENALMPKTERSKN